MKSIDFFQVVSKPGLRESIKQWGSLATLSQYRIAYRKTDQYVKPPAEVLDWGAGNGHFSYFLTSRNIKTVGYSFDAFPPALASEPLFSYVLGQDPVSLPFGNASFDAVLSVGVLEHVHEVGGDQRASLLEIHRVLKTGGLFLCFHLPNKYTWIECIVRAVNRLTGPKIHQHSKLYTAGSFNDLLRGTSFQIIDSGRYNFFPRNVLTYLPQWFSSSKSVVSMIDHLDDALAAVFPIVCQNWYFVVRKAAGDSPRN